MKRQPLYFEPAQLDLDARVPSKKHAGGPIVSCSQFDEGRDYLGWMAENFSEPAIRDFVRRILAGEEVSGPPGAAAQPALVRGRRHEGGEKRAVPSDPGQRARAGHRERARWRPGACGRGAARRAPRRVQGRPGSARSRSRRASPHEPPVTASVPGAEGVGRAGPYAPTEKQVAFYQRLADSPVFTEDERRRAFEWLATKATRQTIKDQIDWLKRQVETRKAGRGQSAA